MVWIAWEVSTNACDCRVVNKCEVVLNEIMGRIRGLFWKKSEEKRRKQKKGILVSFIRVWSKAGKKEGRLDCVQQKTGWATAKRGG